MTHDPVSASLLVRWTIGESEEHRLDSQAFSMLRVSIRAARLLFPEAAFAICHNNLVYHRVDVEQIADELSVREIDVSTDLPKHLGSRVCKNSWWKYAPLRLSPCGFELVLDNDVVLWRRPSEVDRWLTRGGLLGLGTEGDDCRALLYYGDYETDVRQVSPQLDLNAGIIGWPPGYVPPLVSNIKTSDEHFHTEQGFTAWIVATYSGQRSLIPYSSVPLLHTMQADPSKVLASCCGGHFCESNFGEQTYWRDTYEPLVTAFVDGRSHAPPYEGDS